MKTENIILHFKVLLLLVYCQYATGQDICHTFLSGLQAKYPAFSSLTEQESFYVQYSGIRGQYDIGDRKGCEKQPSMNYYALVRRHIKEFDLRIQEETGICVIKECTKEMLRNDKALMISFMGLNNFPINDDEIVELYDMHEPAPKSIMFYICVLLHIGVVVFSICCTIIIYKRQKQRQRLEIPETTPEVSMPQNHYLMEAFDLRAALKSFYQTAQEQKQNENIAVFGFLRVFAIVWVMFTHSFHFSQFTTMPIGPAPHLTPFRQFILNGVFAVDCFFVMGGFLAVYVLVPKLQKEKLTLKSLFLHMKHRFMRIWPLCMAAVLFHIYIMRYMFTSPMWGRYDVVEYCNKYWLSKIFLVDNLAMEDGEGACVTWTWYASVDLQGFFFVLLIVSVYVESRMRGYLFTALFIILSLIIGADRGNIFNTYYVFTPARLNETLIGVLFGMHYYEYAKLKSKINMYWLCERFVIAKYLVLLCGVGLWYYIMYYPHITNSIVPKNWFLLSKCLACLACGVTFAPMNAQNSFWLKSFFNLRLFQILSKLSFGTYLFHIPFIWSVIYTRNHSIEYSSSLWMTETAPKAILGGTVVAAFYWFFLERPLLVIETHSHKKQHPPHVAATNSKELLQKSSNQACSDPNNSSIELSSKQLEHGTRSPKPAKSLGIDKGPYQPLQEMNV